MRRRSPRVAIIGAGMSGICMAVTLQRDGIGDFILFEKADRFGGTWRENTYPGLTCDVPSRFYQFSFAKNPEWSHFFAPGAEIHAYFADVAHECGLASRTRFGTEVVGAEFDGARWELTTADGAVESFDFVLCATGFLHHPRTPDISGLGKFAGPMFHSARWNHDVELAGKRVGVLGTGSTGVQIVTALAGNVAHLSMFQRTPQWILPLRNRRYSRLTIAAHRRFPALDEFGYAVTRRVFEFLVDAVTRPGLKRELVGRICRANLRSVRDPALRAALTPDYQPMCKRLVVSGSFYRAVQRDSVEVVCDAIDHIEPRGIVTADGRLHELDVLVLATGFDAHAFMRPMGITGTDGRTLDQVWADGPRAFETVAIPGFPNMFLLIGPHSPVGNYPLTLIAETQAEHILGWIRRWRDGEFGSVEPTVEATRRYYEELWAAMPNTVWATGCQSWYLGKDGVPELWPWTPARHRALMARRPDPANYRLTAARG
ncbi:NAD(P)/FAD-dependent oxidoreductase [Nocardia sp. NBC_00565]|uniref:flavin-containing monooxygenase n=1 Tax=Nocardia sp. NBC_00565 TaxID=2975993 RepID=UPI002E8096AE|nr:NAD(P)/FAD-dependent oxidoreductase [Nocardia sp. NBC_00565]WUC07819.1 NAD(P)/FAD-dependent oxidoreductase [Nocardia sp. NBC_00565]